MSSQVAEQQREAPRKPTRTGVFAGIRLGSVAGFEISLDYSWFIIFFLILGTFGGAVFPAHAPELGRITHLLMGLVGALLFFISLLLHELAHSFAARWKGVEVEGITLFIFGGMARTKTEASTPGDEFIIAGVGPLASFAIAAVLYMVAWWGPRVGLGEPVTVVAEYLAFLNVLLAVFNLFPGFPLDGGRLLRATLWKVTGNLLTATRTATAAGRFLGWMIIALGVWALLAGGAVVGGLWFVFIGWFLTQAAQSSYQHVLLQQLLSPLSAREAMSPDPETVSPDLSVDDLIHDYFMRRPYNSFPVTEDGIIVGLVTLSHVKGIAREKWSDLNVAAVMTPLHDTLVVEPDLPMMTVMERMRDADARRAIVAREMELVGIISTSDIARWMERVSLVEAEEGRS
ncbi:MAG: CBS domain-containing protein [Gemmatimonadales bacterium]|nr:MAG: CBS domain-containing protein [Gemmatimonadales bacterium]